MQAPPLVVAFDVIETLFPLEPLRPKLQAAGMPAHTLETWFAQLLRNAFALNATDSYRTFREIAVDALQSLATAQHAKLAPSQVEEIIGTFTKLDPHQDVAPAMGLLQEADVRIVTLTNGSAGVTQQLLERAELMPYIEKTISVDEVRLWKPRREVYLHCAKTVGVEPQQLALIAAHGWDIQGAAHAGLMTGYVSRGKPFPSVMPPPLVSGDDLEAVARHLMMR
jgi:2-haloacid dehalogenase